jgi:hypothetical protein
MRPDPIEAFRLLLEPGRPGIPYSPALIAATLRQTAAAALSDAEADLQLLAGCDPSPELQALGAELQAAASRLLEVAERFAEAAEATPSPPFSTAN